MTSHVIQIIRMMMVIVTVERGGVMMVNDVVDLHRKTGCGLGVCKKAIVYASEHKGCTALGYLKAKGLAVSTPYMTFEQRVKMMSEKDDNEQ